MNIVSIIAPAAVAARSGVALPTTGSSPTFAQHFDAGILSGPGSIASAAAPLALPSTACAPLLPATGATVPAEPPAPLQVPVAGEESLLATPAPASAAEPPAPKRCPIDTRIVASDDALTVPFASLPPSAPVNAAATLTTKRAGVGPAAAPLVVTEASDAPDLRAGTETQAGTALDDQHDDTAQVAVIEADVPPMPITNPAALQTLPAALQPLALSATPVPMATAQEDTVDAPRDDARPPAAAAAVPFDNAAASAGIAKSRLPVDGLAAPRVCPELSTSAVAGAPALVAAAPAFAARLSEAYPGTAPAAVASMPVVEARLGRIGHDMGIEIARRLSAGKEELTVRLNPADMGRVEVRMGFDEAGNIRAVVAAESPAALELLRRDAGDLARALADAGIRSDAQSFRFDTRGGDAGQSGQRSHQDARRPHEGAAARQSEAEHETPLYRPLRTSGRVDLMA